MLWLYSTVFNDYEGQKLNIIQHKLDTALTNSVCLFVWDRVYLYSQASFKLTEIQLPLLPGAGINGICHYAQPFNKFLKHL